MAKSRGRKFAELVAPTNGVFAAASIPTIALSKLASSTFSVNSESASLGGNVELDSNDITEHSSALYFTNARADARITAHNLLARAGGTMTGNLTLGDNVNAYFGANTDLRIYHDGTNSHIINSTGELRFSGSNLAFKSDSAKLYFGADDDLQIYHDGLNSYIRDTGTGALRVAGSEVSLLNAAHSEFMVRAVENGAVTLYHDSSAKLATTSTGVQTTGTLNVNGAYSFPTSDGTSGQVLQTDGSGNLTFATGGGAGDITAVVAGTNLTGGATSGSATVNLAGSLTSMTKITFTTSNVQAPTTSDATTGARLVLYPNGSGRDYSIGIESDTMWFNSDADYKWYSDGSLKFNWNNTAGQLEIGGNKVWHAGNDGASSDLYSQYTNTLVGTGGISNAVGSNHVEYSGQISASVSGLFSASNNANGILRLNTHPGNYYHDLGFSSDGNMYHRNFNNSNAFTTAAWYKVWDASNDGSGSGLNADLLDGLDSPDFARRGSSYSTMFDGTATSGNLARFYCNGNIATASAYQTRLEVYSGVGVGTDAFMTFHVGSDYAAYFGMDGGINDLAYGGWSKGSNSNRVWHAANDGSGSGLDADTVDGIQAASFLRSDTNDSVGTDVRHDYGPNSTWSSTLRIGGNGYTAGQNNAIASVVTTNGNLHLDSGGNRGMYLNHYSGTAGVAFGSGSSGAVAWMGADGDLWKGTADNTGSKYWHAGNDGAGSGLDADTVDGISSASFARVDAGSTYGNYTHLQRFYSNTNIATGAGTQASLEAFSATAGGDAFMTFHVGGDYAQYFGLDGGTNQLSTGGWSFGGTSNTVWHAGNDGSGSGLDADLLDGLQGTSYMRDTGMATNRDDYVNLRVVRNSGSSAGSNGMYIGYGNAGSGVTRLYGGGGTSNHISISNTAITFNNIALNGFTLNNGQDMMIKGALTGPTSGQNAQNGGNYEFGYQYLGAWSHPYPDLVLGYHTGMRLGGHTSYGGTRIYADHPHRTTSILFSVGNGDSHVRATNNIYAYTSDKRLKENFRPIENAVDKVKSINGLIFDWRKDMMEKHDFTPDQEKDDAGLIAQEVQKVMPAAIRRAPFDHDLTAPNQSKSGEEFLTVQYEKMVPLLVEAIKEQQKQIDELKKLLEEKE